MYVLSLILIYWIAGVFLAVPYCFIAGWDSEKFTIVSLIIPVMFLIWYGLGILSNTINYNGHFMKSKINWSVFNERQEKNGRFSFVCFWTWTGLVCLPIMLNFTAILTQKFGYGETSSLLKSYRFDILIWLFCLTLFLCGAIILLRVIKDRVVNLFKF